MSMRASPSLLISYKAASDAVGKAAMFAVVLIAARRLSTPAFGVFSLAATLGWILSVATDFGLQLQVARAISRRPERLSAILVPILRLRSRLVLAAALAVGVGAAVRLPPAEAAAFSAIVAAYLLGSLAELINYAYRAVSRSDLESTLNLLQRIGTAELAAVLLAVMPSLGALSIALLVPQAIALAISLRLLRRLDGFTPAAPEPPALDLRTFGRDALPIGAAIVLSALYFRIDLFLVEHWRGLEAVAQYNAVFRMIDALRLFPAAVVGVLLPRVLGRPDPGFAWTLALGLAIAGATAAAVGYAAAPWLVHLAYGERYAPATPVLQVLFLAFPLLCLNYGLTHQAIGWGRQGAYAGICAAALVLNVGANLWLIPRLGTVGAAWTTVMTETVLTAALVTVLATTRPPGASWRAASATAPGPDAAAPAPVRERRP